MNSNYELIYEYIKDINSDNREIYDDFISLLINQKSNNTQSYKINHICNDIGQCDNYADIDRMTFHLSLQLISLEEKGFCLLFLQKSDIIVINNELYLLSNLSQMVPLCKKDDSQLLLVCPTIYPFPKEVCSPELLEINVLPFVTHRSAGYYSLALLSLLYLKGINLSLDDLQGTKLYYFLKRSLKKVPNERLCLYF